MSITNVPVVMFAPCMLNVPEVILTVPECCPVTFLPNHVSVDFAVLILYSTGFATLFLGVCLLCNCFGVVIVCPAIWIMLGPGCFSI